MEETTEIGILDQNIEESYDDVSHDIGIKLIDYQTPVWSHIRPGYFLLVDFIGGLRKKKHILIMFV